MKYSAMVLCILIILLCCLGCTKKEIEIDYKNSWFSDYEIKENKVVLYCVVSITNHTFSEKKFCIQGNFIKDYNDGLLVERTLVACGLDNEDCEFRITGKSEITIKIRFIGTYAGKPIRRDRLLPALSLKIVE